MKTAVSIPDDVYDQVESLARELKVTRSRLYADALRDYLAKQRSEAITESWNRAIAEAGEEEVDPFVMAAAIHRLRQVEWKE